MDGARTRRAGPLAARVDMKKRENKIEERCCNCGKRVYLNDKECSECHQAVPQEQFDRLRLKMGEQTLDHKRQNHKAGAAPR